MNETHMDATWGGKVLTRQQYASDDVDLLHQKQCYGHQLKVGRSCGDRSWRKWSGTQDVLVCKGAKASDAHSNNNNPFK